MDNGHNNTEDHNTPTTTSNVFVPESEHLTNPEEFQSHLKLAESEMPQTSIPSPSIPSICSINLKEGCYQIAYRPNSDFHVYNGTFRVDRSEGTTVISGDLYQFLNSIIRVPSPLSDLVENIPESSHISLSDSQILNIFVIPVYPRRQYYSYLNVIGIQINSGTLFSCNLNLTVEEYLYTQPPIGSFDGTFSPSPRVFTIILFPATPPFGFTNPYFEGKLYVGGMEKGSFSMGWISSFFRKATLEIAVLQGAVAPQPVPSLIGTGLENFRTIYATCGWDVNAVVNPNLLSAPPGVNPNTCWTNAALHNLMTTTVHSSDTHLDKVWHLHVLVVPGSLGCGRGIMFDTIDVPREGVASFCDDGYPTSDSSNFGSAANQKQRNTPRAFLRSACHEAGHGFNQQHQEITSMGEPGADNSIMTTTPSVADVLAGPTSGDPGFFPNDIALRFNRHVRHHMIHFPDIVLRPGGMSFGVGHSTTVPQSDINRQFFSPEYLKLKLSTNTNRVKLGQPLQIDWQIVNTSKVNIPIPSNIGIEAQHTYITVYDPNGHSKVMKSFIIQTDSVHIKELKPGDTVESSTTLFWSSNGFAFEMPGRHIIDIITIWNYEGIQYAVKKIVEIWCDYPTSEKDNEIASMLMHKDVGKFIALGGEAFHLEGAVSRIEKVKADYPNHSVGISLHNLKTKPDNENRTKEGIKRKQS